MPDRSQGDRGDLKPSHTILQNVDSEVLAGVASDYLDLLGTSVTVLEKNGGYALCDCASGWCRLLEGASRQLCHESHWDDCALPAMESGQPVDVECNGGLRLHGLPIVAGDEVVGVISFAYGGPPGGKAALKKIAKRYGLEPGQLARQAQAHPDQESRGIDLAKKRLATSARLIGATVEARTAREALKYNEARVREARSLARVGSWELDLQNNHLMWSQGTRDVFEVESDSLGPSYQDFLQLVHPEDRDMVDQAFTDAVREHTPYDVVHRLVMPDGRVKVVHERCAIHYDQHGRPLRALGAVQDITEQNEAEEALRKSEEHFRLLAEGTSDVIWTADLSFKTTYVSPSVEKLFGFTPEERKEQTLEEMVTPESAKRVAESLARELARDGEGADPNRAVSLELEYLHKNGSTVWAETSVKALRDAEGNAVGLQGVTRDISERKKAEEALRKSEKRYRQLFQSMLSGFALHEIITDQQGKPVDYRFLEVNPAFERLTGLRAEELLGRTVLEVLPATEKHWIETYGRMALGGEPKRFESYHQTLGRHFAVAAYCPAPGQFATVFQDITVRKKAEDQLRQTLGRLTSHIENSPLGVVEFDRDHRVMYWSPRAEDIFGWQAEEVVGQTLDSLRFIHEEDAQQVNQLIADMIAGRSSRNINFNRNYHKDGTIIDCAWYNSALRDGQGELVSVFCSVLDVTERKKNEEALRQSEEKFRASFENAGIGMALVDLEGRYLSINAALCRMLGYSQEEMMSMTFMDITHPEDLEASLARATPLIEGRVESYAQEKRYVHKNGDLVWAQLNVALVRDSSGRPLHTVAQVADITERKKAEEELAQIFSMSLDPTCVADIASATFLKVNPAFTTVLGYSEQELLGTSFLDFHHPDDVEPTIRVMREQLNQGAQVINFVNRYRHKSGHYVWLSWNSHPDLEKGITYAVAHDITQQRRYEQELRDREVLLNEVGKIAKIGGWEMDLITREAKWTRGIYDIVEIEHDQPIPGPDEHLDWYLPEFRPMIQESMRALEQDDVPLDFEAQARTAKGKVIWCRALGRAERVDRRAVRLYGTFQDITERKNAEEALRESELWLQSIFNSQADAIFVLTPDRQMVQANPATIEMFGYTHEELSGHSTEVVHVDQAHYQEFGRRIEQAFARNETAHFEYECKRKNGEVFPTEHMVSLLKDPDGQPMGILSVVRDITERKRVEETIAQTQERFRIIFQKSPVGIELFNHQGDLLEINQGSLDIFGFELIGGGGTFNLFRDLDLPPGTMDQIKKGRTARFEFPFDFERHSLRGLCKSSKTGTAHLDVMIVPTTLAKDQPHGFMVHLQDITERKRAEEELLQTQERFRQLMEQSPMAIEIYDHEGNQMQVNRAYEKLWGFPASHTVGKFNLFKSEEVARRGLLEYAKRAYAGEAVNIPPYRFDATGPTEGRGLGRTRWLKTRVYPLKDSQGQVHNIVITHEDVTEVRQAEEHAKALEAQLRQSQKLEAVGTLAGGIAHDFNNILAAIMGYAELTQDDLPPGHPGRDNVQQILKAIWRARDLVRQILNFSRPGEEHQQPMRLSTAVQEALKLLRPSIPTYIDIQQNISDEDLLVMADQSQMHQVLMNLCTNAAQAMTGAGVIEVGLKKVTLDADSQSIPLNLAPGDYQMLWVSDSGQGMDQQTLARIYDPFFTTKEPGAGTGMGLSVVHGIVQAHNGVVAVDSQPGQGTTFQVYLPVMKEGALPSGQDAETLPSGSESILLVDDEAALVEVGRQILERLGYQVTTITSSLEAAELFQNNPEQFDLVITDYTMPGLTGTALAEHITAVRPEVPIILCTGYSSDHVTDSQLQGMGIRALVQKPLRSAEIAKVVRQVLDQA